METIIGGKDGVHLENNGEHIPMDSATPTEELNINANQANDLHSEHVDIHSHESRSRSHSKHEHGPHGQKEDVTAHKILNLLSEIGHSSFVDNLSFMEKQFHPCKYCKGRLQIL